MKKVAVFSLLIIICVFFFNLHTSSSDFLTSAEDSNLPDKGFVLVDGNSVTVDIPPVGSSVDVPVGSSVGSSVDVPVASS